ncbi:class I SAM-dependent methyltransferase [Pseudonocardia petroleophila]
MRCRATRTDADRFARYGRKVLLRRLETALQRHPRTITRLRDLLEDSPGFAAAIWRLRSAQRVHLDYPVRSAPRYGHGKPAHPRLHELISRTNDAYAALLIAALDYREELASIPAMPGVGSSLTSWRNGWLPPIDMVAHYTLIRSERPARYVEIGSGESTKLARMAVTDGGLPTEIISVDPFPRAEVNNLCDRVIRNRLEDADLAVFSDVQPGDIVFFDGSHRSFMNSDVSVFFLEVLPELPRGLLIGIHDIDLPWDYRPEWAIRYYNEQYLLAVHLLAAMPEIVFPSRHVAVTEALASILDPLWADPRVPDMERVGGAFWFRT